MLLLIETDAERRLAQRDLERQLKHAFDTRATRTIGFPSGNVSGAKIWLDGEMWFYSHGPHRDEGSAERLFNWFGLIDDVDKSSVDITVEINIPIQRNARVAGCFVIDAETGVRYLAHDGKVGGGRAGVGKTEFLAWSNLELVHATDSTGKIRQVILVMAVDGAGGALSLKSFVNRIAAFKRAVRNGDLDTPAFQAKVAELKDYYSEGRGARSGTRSSQIDYISRHGDVVDALQLWRVEKGVKGLVPKKNVLVDLAFEKKGRMEEIYEVKTSAMRADIYTAIGQLLTHARGDHCVKHVVIPQTPMLPADLVNALKRLDIGVIYFTFDKVGDVLIHG